MRSFGSIVLAMSVVIILSGCGGGDSTTSATSSAGADASPEAGASQSATGAVEQADGPTVFGVDGALQAEMRVLIAQFIEEQQIPGDPAENLEKAFDAAMQKLRRPAEEFGIEPDAEGNLEWPAELQETTLKTLRAEFDANTLFDSHEIDLPEWARPLLNEYKANTISPARKELLFRLASGDVIMDMT